MIVDPRDESVQAPAGGAAPHRAGARRLLLIVVLLAVGCAVGYAAYRATGAGADPGPPPGDVQVVSKGDPVDLASHAVSGKYTIYDFYADWCPPCRMLDVQLRDLAARHPNVAVRKIDIIDWTTPVVAQHGVRDLPHMVLYGPDGQMMAAGDDVYPVMARLFNVQLY